MGKVIINGKTYDSLTGLKLDIKDAPDQVEDVKLVAKEIPTQTKNEIRESPRQKRVSKQARLAEAVAQEFADENRRHKNSSAHSKKEVSQKIVSGHAPAWISNFVEGNDPIEIQPVVIKESFSRLKHRAAPNHHSHTRTTKSQTLNRSFVKKPTSASTIVNVRKIPKSFAKHPNVHHFAPSQVIAVNNKSQKIRPQASSYKPASPDVPFVPALSHSTAQRITSSAIARQPSPQITSSELKDILIKNQLDQPIDNKSRRKSERAAAKMAVKRRFTRTTLITAALSVLMLGGYLTYINMPALSIRVAANQAGIDSQSPYTPNGYSIDGPVSYSPGRLVIKYKSNSGSTGYSITEENSKLSEQDIVNNVIGDDNSKYETTKSEDATIYHYGDDAVWTKDGVVYVLKGNSLLSDDQISRIVESV